MRRVLGIPEKRPERPLVDDDQTAIDTDEAVGFKNLYRDGDGDGKPAPGEESVAGDDRGDGSVAG